MPLRSLIVWCYSSKNGLLYVVELLSYLFCSCRCIKQKPSRRTLLPWSSSRSQPITACCYSLIVHGICTLKLYIWHVSVPSSFIYVLPELHADLFSRHASPLELYVFVAIDERDDVMSNEIFRRCNGKQQRRRRGGRKTQLHDWVMDKIIRQDIIALTWITNMKSLY